MVKYYKKIFLFNVQENWYNYQYSFWDIFSLKAFLHIKDTSQKKIPALQSNSYTIELNLEQDLDVIYAKFSKQIRQQIKIAENEGTYCTFHNEVDEFVAFFNDFAAKKDTYKTSSQNILALGDAVKLSFAINDGKILAAHSYLVDDEIGIVRHLHSATKRLDEQYDRNLIGRANKLLTVKDICYFKSMGYKTFDFGGYEKDTEDESMKGINNYKLLFGGEIVTCINYYSYNYWLLKKVSKFLGLTGKM